MDKKTLEQFFSGKTLRIPAYQRDYAWEPRNVDELWNDIHEAIETGTSHYIGTFILANPPSSNCFDVVDGQQRLTTITMLLRALINRLPASDERRKIVAEEKFLFDSGTPRLSLLGKNHEFFQQLISGKGPDPTTSGQKRLSKAFQRVCDLADVVAGSAQASKWIDGISRLNVLEFIEANEGNAIRIFATVNDRGQPLATIDKIKSFLIYVSNRFLSGGLDDKLQSRFGQIFRHFDTAKALSQDADIDLVKPRHFTEDSVLQYHFIAYPSPDHDPKFTSEDVLEHFLKPTIKGKQSDPDALGQFLEDYSADLEMFFAAFERLMHRAGSVNAYYKLLSSLPLAADLYPLLVRLETRGLLDADLGGGRTLLREIELLDLKVYKIQRSSPRTKVARLAADARERSASDIARRLAELRNKYGDDERFRYSLSARPLYEEAFEGARYILLEHDEYVHQESTGTWRSVDELRALRGKEPTVDHVLAQTPGFQPESRGFQSEDQYQVDQHRLGNLTLVEKVINSAGQAKTPEQKATEDKLYKASSYSATRKLGASIGTDAQAGRRFTLEQLNARNDELVRFALDRWPR